MSLTKVFIDGLREKCNEFGIQYELQEQFVSNTIAYLKSNDFRNSTALEVFKHVSGVLDYDTKPSFVGAAFVWHNTPEGQDYWYSISQAKLQPIKGN